MRVNDFLKGMRVGFIPVLIGYKRNSNLIQKNNNGSGMGRMEQADGLY